MATWLCTCPALFPMGLAQAQEGLTCEKNVLRKTPRPAPVGAQQAYELTFSLNTEAPPCHNTGVQIVFNGKGIPERARKHSKMGGTDLTMLLPPMAAPLWATRIPRAEARGRVVTLRPLREKGWIEIIWTNQGCFPEQALAPWGSGEATGTRDVALCSSH